MCLAARTPDATESKELCCWLKRPRRADASRIDFVQCSGDARPRDLEGAASHEEYVRKLIRQYNEEGLATLRTRAQPGRPPALTLEDELVVGPIEPFLGGVRESPYHTPESLPVGGWWALSVTDSDLNITDTVLEKSPRGRSSDQFSILIVELRHSAACFT